MEFAGPRYQSMKIEGAAIRIRMSHDAGLTATDKELHGFQIAGADHHFVDAQARIDAGTLLISSPQVSTPLAVRYAWSNYPAEANLINRAALPAAPFRTDDWDALTEVVQQFTGK